MNIPELTLLVDQRTNQYALTGWPELMQFGVNQSVVFNFSVREAAITGLNEVDTLRLLVSRLLNLSISQQNVLTYSARNALDHLGVKIPAAPPQ